MGADAAFHVGIIQHSVYSHLVYEGLEPSDHKDKWKYQNVSITLLVGRKLSHKNHGKAGLKHP